MKLTIRCNKISGIFFKFFYNNDNFFHNHIAFCKAVTLNSLESDIYK